MNDTNNAGLVIFYAVYGTFILAGAIPIWAGRWAMFKKAGQPGWAAIIPVYKWLVTLKLIGRPWWWILFVYLPIGSTVISIFIYIDLSKAYGRDPAYTVGFIFVPFVFYPIVGFGSATYLGPPRQWAGYPPQSYPPLGYAPPGYPPPSYPPPGYRPPGIGPWHPPGG